MVLRRDQTLGSLPGYHQYNENNFSWKLVQLMIDTPDIQIELLGLSDSIFV